MVSVDEVRAEFYEALKQGERGAVENYLGSVVHAAIREALDDPVVRQLFSGERAVIPPWMNPDEKTAADDLLRLAAAGFAYRGNSIINLVGLTETTPRVDFMNLQRVIEEKRLKLAVLIVKKLFQLGGGAPDGVLPRMGCGDCEEEDIYKLSEALVFAISEN
jgi:hypothetical protein